MQSSIFFFCCGYTLYHPGTIQYICCTHSYSGEKTRAINSAKYCYILSLYCIYCTFTVHRQVFIAVVIDSKVDLGEGREGSSTVGVGSN